MTSEHGTMSLSLDTALGANLFLVDAALDQTQVAIE
jgi:hypothetical protein